jgi:hypothetical protein
MRALGTVSSKLVSGDKVGERGNLPEKVGVGRVLRSQSEQPSRNYIEGRLDNM